MSTRTEVRDAIVGQFRTAWLASAAAAVPIHYDDVRADATAADANGLPGEFVRITVRHLEGASETIGAAGKELHLGQVIVQVFTKPGQGRTRDDVLCQIAKAVFQRQRITGVDGWFFSVTANEVENPASAHVASNVVAQFRYSEQV